MLEQFAIFTPQGEILYQFNCLGRKFAETQINRFVSQYISSRTSIGASYKKYSVLDVSGAADGAGLKSSRSFCCMFHISKQPELFYVVTYAEQSLELNDEAAEVLKLGVTLWDSLQLNDGIVRNLSGRGHRNEHNYVEVTEGLEETIAKFDTYLRAKYEAYARRSEASKPVLETESVENNPKKKSSELKSKKKSSSGGQQGRKWGRDGMMDEIGHSDPTKLDFSEASSASSSNVALVDKESFGKRTVEGEFLIREIDDLLVSQRDRVKSTAQASNTNAAFSFLKKHILGNKTISEEDLKSVLDKLQQKLISKNVAPEVARHLSQQVSKDLIGSKTANWTSVENTARESLIKALTQILTPGVSVDLLHEIQKRTSQKDSEGKKHPYVFSIVGVNGVGKSTNLSKLAFWLLQNNFNVLIVACDTFRSGAVEQLRVHVENLAQLTDESHVRGSRNRRGKSGNDHVELFEAGYGGSDLVAKIAKQAIKYAKDQNFDVVLMDTAGRRHNDPTLMSPLKSFAEQANPDKIIMVGEALVGTDSVQQAKNFNNAFGKVRNLDFFIVSKCDTVGEMLGTMVNMVYATGIPILFVGVGQTYTDLRTLSVKWAVDTLMS
ncbi:hypothetical protein HG536_0E03370 [Torulaspora globosa]|uniref:Signal recognition particle receptor subunit alpha homolog n=1 Tax=Torulaspora globosa TaxID=48254 RepID=A0A7G3ZIU0_9SACH|nr:uncharacterized protein HG536_0E03370 [Torulaspora globosa]QLL33426.1 hypothetical protein HG536_0E03370 [Torulaspora globosa]